MKIGLLGCGIVGSGVLEIIDSLNTEYKIVKILAKETINDSRYTTNPNDILDNEEINIVVEAMGGISPSFDFVLKAIKNKKHVVTSNKELVEKYGHILLEEAKNNNVNFLFEASVGGGIPLISVLNNSFKVEPVLNVYGILNGTSNYILSKMHEDKSFEEALKEAQQLGYAEKDPTNDVKGLDAGRKICIIANMITGKKIDFNNISITGIENISKNDIKISNLLNCQIKLLCIINVLDNNKFSIKVEPTFINNLNPLYTINYATNALLVQGKYIKDVMLVGQGAGRYPTASAVVADVFSCNKINDVKSWNDTKLEISDSNYNVVLITDKNNKDKLSFIENYTIFENSYIGFTTKNDIKNLNIEYKYFNYLGE